MLLTLLLACSDPPPPGPPASPMAPAPAAPAEVAAQAPAPTRQPPGPSSAAPATLLVRGADCGLSLLTLPAGSAEPLAAGVPCDDSNVVLAADGQRVLMGRVLVDLRTGVQERLPEPPRPGPDADLLLSFDPAGEVLAFLRWGEEEVGFEEGPVYARNVEVVHALVEGAWVERARSVTGPEVPQDPAARDAWVAASQTRGQLLLVDAGAGEWVPEGALRDALSTGEPGDWFAAGTPARFAWRMEQIGEGSEQVGPLRVHDGAAWFPVEGTDAGSFRVGQAGDWLLFSQASTWQALDLSNGAVGARGQGQVWAWPVDVPLPETCTLSADALTPALASVGGVAAEVQRDGRAVVERLALPDGTRLERHIGGCHHLLVAYTWRGGALPAAPLQTLVTRLEGLALRDPTDGVRTQLVEAARGASQPEGQSRVDLSCGEASCGFSWGEEQGEAVITAEYMFTL